MDRGSYINASGGLLQLKKLDIINNNLANVNTPGFKGQFLISKERAFEETLASKMNIKDPYMRGDHERTPGAFAVGTGTDFSAGSVEGTGNPLDVALRDPNAFFVVQTGDEELLTRAGNFSLNGEGQLVTQDGLPVMGDGGPITIKGSRIKISSGGIVTSDSEAIGTLKVVKLEDPGGLERVEGSRFRLRSGAVAGETVEPDLIPESLERSNISALQSVIQLISANRGFELYTKTAQSLDEMNMQAITRVGKKSN